MSNSIIVLKESNTFGLMFVDKHGKIQRWDRWGGWHTMPNTPSQVVALAVGGGIWCLDTNGDIHEYHGTDNKWVKDTIAKNVTAISADETFGFWCVNREGELFRKVDGNWESFDQQPGQPNQPPAHTWVYTVKDGDTVYKILRAQAVPEAALPTVANRVAALNPGVDINSLTVGQKLTLPKLNA